VWGCYPRRKHARLWDSLPTGKENTRGVGFTAHRNNTLGCGVRCPRERKTLGCGDHYPRGKHAQVWDSLPTGKTRSEVGFTAHEKKNSRMWGLLPTGHTRSRDSLPTVNTSNSSLDFTHQMQTLNQKCPLRNSNSESEHHENPNHSHRGPGTLGWLVTREG
jgi:hypothetical protein